MRKIEDVLDSIKYGSVLKIKQEVNEKRESIYNCYLLRYDGKIFKDVLQVEISKFLNLLPNIKGMIDEGYTYQVNYDNKTNKYFSSIVDCESPTDELVINNENLFDGMIDLDTKIANTAIKRKIVYIKKYISGAFEKVKRNGTC